MKDTGRYDDIINLPHPTSKKHKRMSLENRAAQFSPFAALAGYDAVIKETARHTDKKIVLSESQRAAMDEKLKLVIEFMQMKPEISVTHFVKDEVKEGGKYELLTGVVKKIDCYNQCIIFESGTRIEVENIVDIQSDLFDKDVFADLFL